MKANIEVLDNYFDLTLEDIAESLNGFELEFDVYCSESEEELPVKVRLSIVDIFKHWHIEKPTKTEV
jgi:hypothetical protein